MRPAFIRQAFWISAILLAVAGIAAFAANTATETVVVADTIRAGSINATWLAVSEISGHRVTGQLDVSSNRIVNAANPADCQDVATKSYVDGVLGGSIGPTCN